MSFGFGFGYPKRVKASAGGGLVGTSYSFLSSVPAPFTASGGGNGGATWTYFNSTPALTNGTNGISLFDYFPATGVQRGMYINTSADNGNVPTSEDFTTASWTKTGSTITAAATTSPRNTATGQKLVEDASTGTHQISANIFGQTAGFPQATLVMAKAAERNWLRVEVSASNYGYFNLSTGTTGTMVGASGIILPLNLGWYACYLYPTSSAATPYVAFGAASADNTNSYTGTSGSGLYVFGANALQLINTTYTPLISYVANTGATQGSVFQPSLTASGANYTTLGINANNGAFVVECVATGALGTLFVIGDGTANNNIVVTTVPSTGVVTVRRVVAGVVATTTATVTWNPTTIYKVGVSWNGSTLLLCINNGTVSSVASTGTLGALTAATVFGAGGAGQGNGIGWIRTVTTYGSALTNTQLQAATA